jgi:hypothetical protein
MIRSRRASRLQQRLQKICTIQLLVVPCVTEYSTTCDACQEMILDHNWHLHAVYNDIHYSLHDNDGVCLSKMKVHLRLQKPNFLSSRTTTV